MKKIRFVLWGMIAIVAVVAIFSALPKKSNVSNQSMMPIAGFNKGEHFTLTDHKGQKFDSDDQIGEGEYALIFFGFTHCPVICPTELQKFAGVMDTLPEDVADKVQPIFITIDPERDTVKVLKDYVPLFHPSIIGLTGGIKTVHQTLKSWKVFYTKVNDPELTEYTMDHSTYAYLVDHEMTIQALFRMKNTSDEIANYIESVIAN